jgi:hypothetical protein
MHGPWQILLSVMMVCTNVPEHKQQLLNKITEKFPGLILGNIMVSNDGIITDCWTNQQAISHFLWAFIRNYHRKNILICSMCKENTWKIEANASYLNAHIQHMQCKHLCNVIWMFTSYLDLQSKHNHLWTLQPWSPSLHFRWIWGGET